MNPEERLKQALRATATDPGAKEEWDGFIKLARRDRALHRAVRAAALVVVAGLVAITGLVVTRSFEVDPPDPADDRKSEEKLEEIEERLEETKELIEDVGIVPGPNNGRGKNPGFVGPDDRKRGQRQEAPPVKEEPPAPTVLSARCRGEEATIVGTEGNDVLRGTSARDVIASLGGDDQIYGGGGGDYICGAEGIDHLYGETGRDSLVGGPGDDLLDGGTGFDFIHFPTSGTGINIDLGNGFVEGDGDDEVVRVEAAEGTDWTDNFSGTDGPNLFSGGPGGDAMNGFGGRDVFFPGPGNDVMDGGSGVDTVAFTSPDGRSGVEVDLDRNVATGDGVDRVFLIENVNGTFENDVISGDDGANSFFGSFGDDTLSGGGGPDVLLGSEGNDTLDGGADSDVLDGGGGQDMCTNGETKQACETTGPLGSLLLWGTLGASRVLRRCKLRRSGRTGVRELELAGLSTGKRFTDQGIHI